MPTTTWTAADIRWLRRFIAEGATVPEIADVMDLPEADVEAALANFGITPPPAAPHAVGGPLDNRLAPIRTECAQRLKARGPLTAKQLSDLSADWLEEEIVLALTGHPSFFKVRGRWRLLG